MSNVEEEDLYGGKNGEVDYENQPAQFEMIDGTSYRVFHVEKFGTLEEFSKDGFTFDIGENLKHFWEHSDPKKFINKPKAFQNASVPDIKPNSIEPLSIRIIDAFTSLPGRPQLSMDFPDASNIKGNVWNVGEANPVLFSWQGHASPNKIVFQAKRSGVSNKYLSQLQSNPKLLDEGVTPFGKKGHVMLSRNHPFVTMIKENPSLFKTFEFHKESYVTISDGVETTHYQTCLRDLKETSEKAELTGYVVSGEGFAAAKQILDGIANDQPIENIKQNLRCVVTPAGVPWANLLNSGVYKSEPEKGRVSAISEADHHVIGKISLAFAMRYVVVG